jgi:hypothetical protein
MLLMSCGEVELRNRSLVYLSRCQLEIASSLGCAFLYPILSRTVYVLCIEKGARVAHCFKTSLIVLCESVLSEASFSHTLFHQLQTGVCVYVMAVRASRHTLGVRFCVNRNGVTSHFSEMPSKTYLRMRLHTVMI